ncbi:MAG: YbaK/EbsC family protein [Clostridia bacterium]|nr:YbaK/EbsC family protein [Clostridia bacterium]
MSLEKVKEYLKKFNKESEILEFELSSATVELAAVAVGTEPSRIAKSLTFMVGGKPIMIVCAGDVKIDNSKYKGVFGEKAKMLTFEEVENLVGHKVGGVCPFAIKSDVKVYLDESLKRFEKVYPACGSGNSAIGLTIGELEEISQNFVEFIDVCKEIL